MRQLVNFLLYDAWSPAYFLDYTLVVNHGLSEEDELYGFYVNSRQVNACNDVTV